MGLHHVQRDPVGPGAVSGLSGAVALSVLMIPTVVRSAEEYLRLVPNELREASLALGVPKWRTVLRVVLPTALAGIVTGVILSLARVIGETAPLLVTMGLTDSLNTDPLHGAMTTLPVFVYYQYTQPGTPPDSYLARAWAGASASRAVEPLKGSGVARPRRRTGTPASTTRSPGATTNGSWPWSRSQRARPRTCVPTPPGTSSE